MSDRLPLEDSCFLDDVGFKEVAVALVGMFSAVLLICMLIFYSGYYLGGEAVKAKYEESKELK